MHRDPLGLCAQNVLSHAVLREEHVLSTDLSALNVSVDNRSEHFNYKDAVRTSTLLCTCT